MPVDDGVEAVVRHYSVRFSIAVDEYVVVPLHIKPDLQELTDVRFIINYQYFAARGHRPSILKLTFEPSTIPFPV